MRRCVTPSPTASMTPTTSFPGTIGCDGSGRKPSTVSADGQRTPAADHSDVCIECAAAFLAQGLDVNGEPLPWIKPPRKIPTPEAESQFFTPAQSQRSRAT
jgi:hypothetical protein